MSASNLVITGLDEFLGDFGEGSGIGTAISKDGTTLAIGAPYYSDTEAETDGEGSYTPPGGNVRIFKNKTDNGY